MTSISPAVSKAAASTRTEAEARRDRARKNVRDAALRWGHDPDEAVATLENAWAMNDLVKVFQQ